MVASHHTGTFTSAGLTLAYRRFGRAGATPLLFVHGLSYFSYDWVDIGSRLAGDRPGCAVDMRGFGDSAFSPTGDYSVPSMGADLLALLDHLGWERCIVSGHSMGGRSAAWLARHHPERVAGLVLVDYSPDNAPAGSKRVSSTVAGTPDSFASVDETMRYFGADAHSPQGAAARERYAEYLRPAAGGYAIKRDPYFREQFRRLLAGGERTPLGADMWQILKEMPVATLVVRGTRSDMFAAETADKVRAANPRITVAEVDAGHNVAGENPDGFYQAVRPFIDSIDARHP
jgi:esterase